MSIKNQIQKNINLIELLEKYFVKHSNEMTKYSGSHYVVFTSYDYELNKMNEKMVDELKEQGGKIVKATYTKSKDTPWRFEPVQI